MLNILPGKHWSDSHTKPHDPGVMSDETDKYVTDQLTYKTFVLNAILKFLFISNINIPVDGNVHSRLLKQHEKNI